jgi:1,2-phenylacetyl-CoA epoxidase catalytic subunit
MAMEPTDFYNSLIEDIDKWRQELTPDDGATFFTRPMSEQELVEWLSFQAYYEISAAKFIAKWLANTPERDAFVLLAQQVEDEALHFEYCMRALERRGVTSIDDWKPEPEWEEWIGQWYPSGDSTLERVVAHNLTGEAGACQAFYELKPRLPEDVAKTLERIIPDEQFHMKIGKTIVERYAFSDEQQAMVRERVRKTFELEQAGRVAYNRRMVRLGIGDAGDPVPSL